MVPPIFSSSHTSLFFGSWGAYHIRDISSRRYVPLLIIERLGLSPGLTEAEVFDSPSRTARLAGAYYHFVSQGQQHIRYVPYILMQQTEHSYLHRKLTRRFERDHTLAVSLQGRMAYSKYLHVWAQDGSYITRRHADLLTAFNVSNLCLSQGTRC